jgi:hypothetical protein
LFLTRSHTSEKNKSESTTATHKHTKKDEMNKTSQKLRRRRRRRKVVGCHRSRSRPTIVPERARKAKRGTFSLYVLSACLRLFRIFTFFQRGREKKRGTKNSAFSPKRARALSKYLSQKSNNG